MSRDIAAAVRSEPTQPADKLNQLLERQMADAAAAGGGMDLQALLGAVSAHYDRIDGERRGVVRSMQLMSDEAQALTREIREQNASHLQAILDNVKDAIVTVDDAGRIETINPTCERIFGWSPAPWKVGWIPVSCRSSPFRVVPLEGSPGSGPETGE